MENRNKLIAGATLLVLTIVMSGWQFMVLHGNKSEVKDLNQETAELSVEKSKIIEQYQAIKKDVSANRDSVAQELAVVFPIQEDLTNLTRLFDDFATKNNFNTNPFFISSLNFKSALESEKGDYMYIPVSLNITTSKKNLIKFLETIENSGSLEGQMRLMSVEDFTVSYPAEYGGTYQVSMNLNAYFDAI